MMTLHLASQIIDFLYNLFVTILILHYVFKSDKLFEAVVLLTLVRIYNKVVFGV